MVGVLGEIQSSSGRVSLIEGEVVILQVPRICDKGALEWLLVEVGYDDLGNLYPRPFNCGVGGVDPSRFADLAELNQVYQGSARQVPYRTTLNYTAVAPTRFEAGPQGSMLRRDDRKMCSPPLG